MASLSDAQLAPLKAHAYKGGEYSWLDVKMNYVWYAWVELLPRGLAPNLITLIGTSFLVSMACGIAYYDPYLLGAAPKEAYAWFAVCIFMYQTLDALDGKQARRTNTSSPLGQLFDHGCDAFGSVCMALGLCSCLSLGRFSNVNAPLILATVQVPFFLAQVEERAGGALRTQVLGIAGVTEGQFLEIFVCLATYAYGPHFWDPTDGPGGMSRRFAIIYGGVVFPALLGMKSLYEIYANLNANALFDIAPLVFLEATFFGLLQYDPSFGSIYNSHPVLVLTVFGILITHITSEIIVCSMLHTRFDNIRISLVVSVLGVCYGATIVHPKLMWYTFAIAVTTNYVNWIVSTCERIATFLGISVLTIDDAQLVQRTTIKRPSKGTPFTHVVLFTLNPSFDAKILKKAQKDLNNLLRIDGVYECNFGETFTTDRAAGFTHCLVVEFECESYLPGYAPHAEHILWAETYIRPFKVGDSLGVDFA